MIDKRRQKLAQTRKTLECQFNTYASPVKVYTPGEKPRFEKKHSYQTAINRTKKKLGGKLANER